MYELCAFMAAAYPAPKKARKKSDKPRAKAAKVGSRIQSGPGTGTIVRKDADGKFWIVFDGHEDKPASWAYRNVFQVI